ncbi:MAG: hypothetical protein ACK4FV_06840 [Candidatus Nitrosocaldus sp.]
MPNLHILASFLILLLLYYYNEAYAHQLFNSGEYRIAGYLIQVATQPEIPSTDTVAKILVRVADSNGRDLQDITVWVRLLKNDTLVHDFPPLFTRDGHLELNYIFHEPGVYVIEVNLPNLDKDISAKFNIGIVKEFGYIFISMIVLGAIMPAVLVAGIMIYKRRSRIS